MNKKITSLAAAVAFMLNCVPLQAAAPEGYKTLDSLVADDGAVVMTLSGNVKYHAFKISNPARIVVELSNTEFNAKNKEIDVSGTIVKRVRGAQFKNEPSKVTRVVIDLSAPCDYQLNGQGKNVTLTLRPKAKKEPSASEVVTAPAVVKKATKPAGDSKAVEKKTIPVAGATVADEPKVEKAVDLGDDLAVSKDIEPATPAVDSKTGKTAEPATPVTADKSAPVQDIKPVADKKTAVSVNPAVAVTPVETVKESMPVKPVTPVKQSVKKKKSSTKKQSAKTPAAKKTVPAVDPASTASTDTKPAVTPAVASEIKPAVPATDDVPVVVAAPLSADEEKKIKEEDAKKSVASEAQPASVAPVAAPSEIKEVKPESKPANDTKKAVKPVAPKPRGEKQVEKNEVAPLVKGALSKKPISLDFEDADIRDVLRVLSLKSGVNIIYGTDVTGPVTLRLDNVPFDKAFETILSLRGLVAQEQGGNIIRVTTPTKIAEERAQAVTFTKVYPLNYAKAEEVKSNLDSIRTAEGRRGNISNDARTNSLIITDTPEGLVSLERIINELDKRPAQVLIEAKIVEVSLTNEYDLGIQWQYASTLVNNANSKVYVGATQAQTSASQLGSNAAANATVVSPLSTSQGGTGVSFPASAVNGQVASIAFGIVSNDALITGVLSALAQKGLSKILSNPKVTTINNKEAKILVGQRIPYTTTTVSTTGSTQSTNFLDVGVKLTVTPTINIDQKITLAVHPEVSLFVRADAAGPVIGTREAQTTVLVGNGETVVIGGLITEEDRKNGTQVPLLGDLPIIGHLFRRDYSSKQRSELLVFLTPHIVNNN